MSLRGEQRQEFPQRVRKLAFARCCRPDGIPKCERPGCGAVLRSGNIEYEHLTPDGLGGEPTLENCGVWCAVPCSSRKTHSEDRPRMQKADRALKKAFGLQPARKKFQNAGFQKAAPQRTASRPIRRKSEL